MFGRHDFTRRNDCGHRHSQSRRLHLMYVDVVVNLDLLQEIIILKEMPF